MDKISLKDFAEMDHLLGKMTVNGLKQRVAYLQIIRATKPRLFLSIDHEELTLALAFLDEILKREKVQKEADARIEKILGNMTNPQTPTKLPVNPFGGDGHNKRGGGNPNFN